MSTGLSIFEILKSEVWQGEHVALVLGWRDDQLAPVVELLAPYLAGDLTPVLTREPTLDMRFAVAACARSLVVDTRLTGQPVRYSRDRDHYGGAKRYRRGDRYYTFHYVTKAVDVLQHAGLIGHALGVWSGSGGRGRQSVAWPSDKLLELLEPVIDAGEQRGEPHETEVIVLRDRDDKRDIDYEETAETTAMRVQVQALNDALGELDLHWLGRQFPIPLVRRIFSGDFERGGRFYCYGPSFQNIPSEERLNLHLRIDGVLHPMVEIDYGNLHIVMAYAEADLLLPPGDQYVIDGFDRSLVKRAANILLNAKTRHWAVNAMTEELHCKNYPLWQCSGLASRRRAECRPLAGAVVNAIEEKHHQITEFFGSDCGAGFQRWDSDMALAVMNRMISRTGRCPLPMHDSLLVADIDQEVLAQTMLEVASEEGLTLCLKDSRGVRSWGPRATTPSSIWGKQVLNCGDGNPLKRGKPQETV